MKVFMSDHKIKNLVLKAKNFRVTSFAFSPLSMLEDHFFAFCLLLSASHFCTEINFGLVCRSIPVTLCAKIKIVC